MKGKIIGAIFLFVGVVTLILGFSMLGGTSESGDLIKEAIYLGEASWQAENDGKLVIVTGEIDLIEPAYDSELGISFNSPRVVRHAQNIKWKKSLEESKKRDKDMFGWKWEGVVSEDNTYYGEAMVNEFKISPNLLEKLALNDIYHDYKEEELNQVDMTLIEDDNFSQRYFIEDLVWRGPENMGYYFTNTFNPENYDDVIRYYYSAYLAENHDGITVIGIQNKDVLDLHETISHHSFMEGKLSQDQVMEQFKTTNSIAFMTSILMGLVCLIIGVIFIVRSNKTGRTSNIY